MLSFEGILITAFHFSCSSEKRMRRRRLIKETNVALENMNAASVIKLGTVVIAGPTWVRIVPDVRSEFIHACRYVIYTHSNMACTVHAGKLSVLFGEIYCPIRKILEGYFMPVHT